MNITVIPATKDIHTGVPTASRQRRRVAAYARVSTDHDEQLTSYQAQVDYYTNFIQRNPEWEYAGTYSDEGISGMMTKKRDGFNRMIENALAGKIDLIITKSVSRFARNTVDSLTTIRKLKEKGVEVYFEKENIYTLDSKGELLLTLMSSLAQEESRSLSQNVTWGQRKRFSDGKVTMCYGNFLGYRKGPDGTPEIDPEESETVRRIYKEFMEGTSTHMIAKHLTADGAKTAKGNTHWYRSTVESILRNERYKGDALLQKTFTQDFLTKKMKKNEGEVPQYYVTGSHPWIIDPKEWDLVQIEMDRREQNVHYASKAYGGKIICGECGTPYGSKVWHSTDKYRKVILQCNNKFDDDHVCSTPHLNEADLQRWFIQAFTQYFEDRGVVVENLRYLRETCVDLDGIREKIAGVEAEMQTTADALRECIERNAAAKISEEEFREQYDELHDQFRKLEAKLDKLSSKMELAESDAAKLDEVIRVLEQTQEIPVDFDPILWRITVEKVLVGSDGVITFTMVGGKEYKFRA